MLVVTAQITGEDERLTKLKSRGTVDGVQVVSARLVLVRYNLADDESDQAATDEVVKRKQRELFSLLYPPAACSAS
jgi:hypothetical protein